jgi:protein-tyrosine phosphatase
VIDIHSHLLPGVDDGSPSVDVSVDVLRRFRDDGVTTVVCTPHLKASAAHAAPWDAHLSILAELEAVAPSVPALRLGWEIMLDRPGVDLSRRELRLGGSRAMLVEFPWGPLPAGTSIEISRLARAGIVPVLAHPERYRGCTLAMVREWREVGAVIQTDASILLAGDGGPMTELARSMLEQGLIDILASDNHGDRRTLATVRAWLLEMGASEQAELLTAANAERLLADDPLLPVPPRRLRRGLLVRLKEMLASADERKASAMNREPG